MQFNSPHWLYIIPAILLLGLVWKRIGLFKPLNLIRIAIIILFGVIMAKPTIQKQQNSLEIWVLLDRSDSTEGLIAQKLPEWDKLLKENKTSKDSIRYIDYAAEVVEQIENSETAVYTSHCPRGRKRTSLSEGRSSLTHLNLYRWILHRAIRSPHRKAQQSGNTSGL